MDRSDTPFLLRAAVMIGGMSLLLGLAGVAILLAGGADAEPDSGPLRYLKATVRGLAPDARPAVEAVWQQGDVEIRQQALRAPGRGAFVLPPLPRDHDVLLRVVDMGSTPPRELASRRLAAGDLDPVEIVLAAEDR